VPIVFFLLRFWGSIRVVLYFSYSSNSEEFDRTDKWLKYMQAIFDPSQGFFNSLLFVVTSKEGRANVVGACQFLIRYLDPLWDILSPLVKCWSPKSRNVSLTNAENAELTPSSASGFLRSNNMKSVIKKPLLNSYNLTYGHQQV
jgi:hypothetical protein